MISAQKIKLGQLDKATLDTTYAPFGGGGGGGDEFLYSAKRWKATGLNTNTWKNPGPYSAGFDNDGFGTYGTATTPTDLTLYGTWDTVPDGYIVEAIEFEVLYRGSGSASNIQVYIASAEVNNSTTSDVVSTISVLVNETVSIPAGAFLMKFTYPLTVASNSLPTLDKKLLFKSVRDLTLNSVTYMFGFNYKFKKI